MDEKNSRSFPRVEGVFEVRYRVLGDLTHAWKIAVTIDLSATGAKFLVDSSVEKGMTLELQLILPSVRNPIIVSGRVIWSKPEDDMVECGIEFESLSPDQRLEIDALVGFLYRSPDPPLHPEG